MFPNLLFLDGKDKDGNEVVSDDEEEEEEYGEEGDEGEEDEDGE